MSKRLKSGMVWALAGAVLCTSVLAGEPAEKAKAVPEPKKGKMYRHVVGFSFWHPEAWTVKEQETFLQLVPPKADARSEVYVIIAENVSEAGIERPDDPGVLSYLDAQVRSLSPLVQRQGGATAVPMARGTGAALEWTGKTDAGQELRARAFVSIIRQHGVALVAYGLRERLAAREDDVRQMFASFGFGEGAKDPALVGQWRLASTYSLQNKSPFESEWSRAWMVSTTKSTLAFQADGSWARTDDTHLIAMGAGVSLEDKDRKVTQGRWNAASGSLYMVWKDNTWEDYQYQVRRTANGVQLRMATGKTGTLWERVE